MQICYGNSKENFHDLNKNIGRQKAKLSPLPYLQTVCVPCVCVSWREKMSSDVAKSTVPCLRGEKIQ